MKILEVKDLTKTYPKFKLDNVSFSMEEGTIMGFIGRNGAGKTTTLKCIQNLVHKDSGTITLFEKNADDYEQDLKLSIGYAGGAVDYYKKKKIKDIIKITSIFYDNWDNEAWKHYCDVFKIDEDKKPGELSEGMKVKFNIALSLSHGAHLLILDEPTSGLDPVSRVELLEIFKALKNKGVSILFSTHIITDLEKCADSITYIKDGKIITSCPLSEINQSLEDLMLSYEKEEIIL